MMVSSENRLPVSYFSILERRQSKNWFIIILEAPPRSRWPTRATTPVTWESPVTSIGGLAVVLGESEVSGTLDRSPSAAAGHDHPVRLQMDLVLNLHSALVCPSDRSDPDGEIDLVAVVAGGREAVAAGDTAGEYVRGQHCSPRLYRISASNV